VGEARDTTQDRVTIQEAARRLGVKEDAIRKRIQRGTLPHEKTEEGRVFVWVSATQDTTQDTTRDAYQDTLSRDELINELRDQVRFLREEMARKDAILLRMAESIPQLEAPPEPRESPTEGADEPERGPVSPEAQSGTSHRPWFWWWAAWILSLLLLAPAMWVLVNLI
jgi:excisionase family DNA binding protein